MLDHVSIQCQDPAASAAFYDAVLRGRQGDQHTRSFAWRLVDATWISPSVVQAARESMSPARFAAEYEGVFASGADALFPRHVLDAATADVVVPGFDGLAACRGLLGGQDWGATTDRSALVALAPVREPARLARALLPVPALPRRRHSGHRA